MAKVIINLKSGISKENFNNGDMLVYDSTKKEFYTVTESTFFDKTNSRINELTNTYEKRINELTNTYEKRINELTNTYETRISELIKKYDSQVEAIEKEKEEIKQETKTFMVKIQESNQKLIEMVDSFIKGGE